MNIVWAVLFSSLALMATSGCSETSSSSGAAPPAVAISNQNSNQDLGIETQTKFIRSYRYVDQGCETGLHEFNSFDDFCLGLLDENLNRQCAKEQRLQTHRLECSKNLQKSPIIVGFKPHAAYCKTKAEDYSEKLSLLKTHENQNLIYWDGDTQRGVRLVGALQRKFGSGYLSLAPTRQKDAAGSAKLVFKSEEQGLLTRLETAAQGSFNLSVRDGANRRNLSSQCQMDMPLSEGDKGFTAVTCDHYFGPQEENFKRMHSTALTLTSQDSKAEGRHKYEQAELFFLVEKETRSLTVIIQDLQGSREIRAQGSLSADLELTHINESSGQVVHIKCYAAQK